MTKPTKWHVRPARAQISLGICPVWSESSLSTWRKLVSLATHWAHSEDSDQTGQMPRLIWVFAGCKVILFVLSWGELIWRVTKYFWLKVFCCKDIVLQRTSIFSISLQITWDRRPLMSSEDHPVDQWVNRTDVCPHPNPRPLNLKSRQLLDTPPPPRGADVALPSPDLSQWPRLLQLHPHPRHCNKRPAWIPSK